MAENTVEQNKSLWELLGLSSVGADDRQMLTRRVVVVGDALSGKRTLVSLLFEAAVQQFPSSSVLLRSPITNEARNGADEKVSSRLQPPTDVDKRTDEFNSKSTKAAESNMAAPFFKGRSFSELPTPLGSRDGVNAMYPTEFTHGVGIAHSFLLQRLPANRTVRGSTEECSNSGVAALYASGCPVRNVLTEFFCCDAPGTLPAALPTVESLKTSVVLVVVDGSTPWSLHEQMQRWYGHLDEHVARTLRAELPKQDEVQRERMAKQQNHFWTEQEQGLLHLRHVWSQRELGCVNGLAMPVMDGSDACPLRSFLVCSKTDQLETLSRELDKCYFSKDTAGSCEDVQGVDMSRVLPPCTSPIIKTPCAAEGVRSALHATRLSLLQLIGQLLRMEAIKRQCGFVCTSSSVNTTTTATTAASPCHTRLQSQPISSVPVGMEANTSGLLDPSISCGATRVPLTGGYSTFVHPLYRSLWSFIFQLLYDPQTSARRVSDANSVDSQLVHASRGADPDGSERVEDAPAFTDDIDCHVSSRVHPYAFLPHGVDHISFISPSLAACDTIRLDSLFVAVEEGGDYAGRVLGCELESGTLLLRDDYLQQIENILGTSASSGAKVTA
uniref:Dynein light intermediate chain n=1 Tax=Trypanosoma congolense (strain IL3000) TaxID=1068625 RepID=G0V2B9_TRYCI|nr:unnamed protein product [Trypanosoma congolense IL3000]